MSDYEYSEHLEGLDKALPFKKEVRRSKKKEVPRCFWCSKKLVDDDGVYHGVLSMHICSRKCAYELDMAKRKGWGK